MIKQLLDYVKAWKTAVFLKDDVDLAVEVLKKIEKKLEEVLAFAKKEGMIL